MLYLSELSIPSRNIHQSARQFSPLLASDDGYAIKTWLAARPEITLRPWRAFVTGDTVRIIGWSEMPQSLTNDEVGVSTRPVEMKAGQALALSGLVCPLRRKSAIEGKRGRSEVDAAIGTPDKAQAYQAWTLERLVELMPHVSISGGPTATAFGQFEAVRKWETGVRRKDITTLVLPFAEVEFSAVIRNPDAVRLWLLKGVGPQKAFGFGGFFPC
jgi:hypothetical protein